MLNLDAYAGIIFDMDGTLVDSVGGHLDAWQQVCGRFGLHFDGDFIHALSGMPSWGIAEKMLARDALEHCPRTIAEAKYQAWLALDHHPDLIDPTYRVFQHYEGRVPIAVGTGAIRPCAELILARVGVLDRLSALVTSSDVSRGKPDGETFHSAAVNMGVEPRRCVVFEDTQVGVDAAHDAAMDCYWVGPAGLEFRPRPGH